MLSMTTRKCSRRRRGWLKMKSCFCAFWVLMTRERGPKMGRCPETTSLAWMLQEQLSLLMRPWLSLW